MVCYCLWPDPFARGLGCRSTGTTEGSAVLRILSWSTCIWREWAATLMNGSTWAILKGILGLLPGFWTHSSASCQEITQDAKTTASLHSHKSRFLTVTTTKVIKLWFCAILLYILTSPLRKISLSFPLCRCNTQSLNVWITHPTSRSLRGGVKPR